MTDVEMTGSSLGLGGFQKGGKSAVEEDLYTKMKELESQMEILQIQEDYLKDE